MQHKVYDHLSFTSINYITAYLELEQLRHQDSTFVKQHIDLKNKPVEIPPYILLPLMENVLKYGVASNDTPIEVNKSFSLIIS